MTNIHSTVILIDIFLYLELGVVPSERLFFNENERNYQKNCSEKKNIHVERTIGTIMKRTNAWNERILLGKNVKIINAFLLESNVKRTEPFSSRSLLKNRTEQNVPLPSPIVQVYLDFILFRAWILELISLVIFIRCPKWISR